MPQLKDEGEKLAESAESVFKEVFENASKFTDEFLAKVEGNYLKLAPYASKLNTNRIVLQRALVLIKDILKILGKAIADIGDTIQKMKNPETLTLFKKIFDERKNPENSDNLRLVWNYTTEEKLDKFEEYMDIWKKN